MKKDEIQKLLDKIDYSVDPNYVPSDFALMMINFIKAVGGKDGGEEHPSPVVHYKMLDSYDDNDKPMVINLCSRGLSKTTLNEYFMLICAMLGGLPNFGKFKHGLYISDTINNGVKKMRNRLEIQMQNSEFLKKVIPEYRFTDIRWYFKNAKGEEMVWGAYGAETGLRGVVELRERPSIALFDDLLTDKNATSPKITKNILHTIYAAVAYALHPTKNKQIWSGTPFNASDPIYQGILSGAWYSNVFPVCEKFPCSREEFRGAWEERFNYDYVKKQYDTAEKTGTLAMFYKELMLSIAHADYALVKEGDIGIVSRSAIIHNKNLFNFYITTDFATTEEDTGDYSVAIVYAVASNGNLYIVDGFCKKQLMSANLNDLFSLVRKWKPIEVGLETSGQQGGFISLIEDKMMTDNTYFNIARQKDSDGKIGKKGFKPVKKKLDRFMVFHPTIEQGKLYICKELENTNLWIEFFEEIYLITPDGIKAAHDDVIDCLSMVPEFNLIYPTENVADPDLLGRDDIIYSKEPVIDIWSSDRAKVIGYEEEEYSDYYSLADNSDSDFDYFGN